MHMYSNISLPGFKGIIIKEAVEVKGNYHLHVEMERRAHHCPAEECGQMTEKVHDYRVQKIQHMKIFARPATVYYRKRRYVCDCGKRFFEENELVDRYQRQSREFKQTMAIELIHGKSFKDVALRLGTSPTTVMRRFDEVEHTHLKETKELPRIIAIDEYKGDAGGERFQTIIADPVNRRPLEILPDRKKETVKEYLKKYGGKVEVVVMDMSHSFKAAVDQALNRPIVVADRFHFVRYIYWALERVRRHVQKDFSDYDRKKCKRMKHVFYKRNGKLTEKQQWYLDRYLGMSDYMRKAYELKEAFCVWFDRAKETGEHDLAATREGLHAFYSLVGQSGVTEFAKVTETFRNWQKEIMNSFAFGLHNGYIEGINNQTKVIKRNAFGFRRFDRFRLRILLHHQYKQINGRLT
ncbi:ISL3 family transposase [Virgibacillus sp. W0430]|uniref:ISL3 family transposase n=1 Tax=Virgibacillus sp. W0430 TaxID=3391580 RepID=UPI003F47AB4B